MRRVIKHKQKMKNTMFVVFGVYSLVLLGITNLNPSYAEENGILLDSVIETVVGDEISNTNEVNNTDTSEEVGEEVDVQEGEITDGEETVADEESADVGEEGNDVDEDGGEESNEEVLQEVTEGENTDEVVVEETEKQEETVADEINEVEESNTEVINNTEEESNIVEELQQDPNVQENPSEQVSSNVTTTSGGGSSSGGSSSGKSEKVEEVVETDNETNSEENNKLSEQVEQQTNEGIANEEKTEEKVEEQQSVEQEKTELELAWETLNDKEITGTYTYNGVIVSVKAPVGSFPKDVKLVITPMEGDELDAAQKKVSNKDMTVFDISFMYTFKDGSKVELEPLEGKNVQVSFNYEKNEKLNNAAKKGERLKVYHIGEEAEELKIDSNNKGEIIVNANKFSPYGIALTKGGSSEQGMVGVTKTPGNITYTDTNGRVFDGIGTITLTDCDGTNEDTCKIITMLDRNLGATSTDIDDGDSYGYHFQWGNNYGFDPNSRVNTKYGDQEGFADASENGWNNPYVSSDFIYGDIPSTYGYGWDGGDDHSYNDDLWGGGEDYYNEWGDSTADYKRQGPCPAGYHVPSQKELGDLLQLYYSLNPEGTLDATDEDSLNSLYYGANYAFKTPDDSDYVHWVYDDTETFSINFRNAFNVPLNGYRYYDGTVSAVASYFWSSSSDNSSSSYSHLLNLYNDEIVSARSSMARGYAVSIRCFQDSPLDNSGTEPLILEYETNGGTAIQSQTIPEGWNGYLPGYTSRKDGEVVTWWNEDGTEQYELDENGATFTNLVMSEGLADENGVVRVYAHREDCPEGYTTVVKNKCARPNGIIYKADNITYTDTNGRVFDNIGTITISYDGESITMLDRNLGASAAGTGYQSYGYYFQWGNNYGFDFSSNVNTIDGSENGFADASENRWNNPYVSSKFITDPSRYHDGGWDGGDGYSYNHDLWGGGEDYYNEGGDSTADYKRQGPCPAGYHVPSRKELNDLILMYSNLSGKDVYDDEYGYYVNEASIPFSNTFKIPFAGYIENGEVSSRDYYAYLWSSSIKDSDYPQSHELYLYKYYNGRYGRWYPGIVSAYDYNYRNYGLSVRCFQDSPLDDSGTQPLILEYETDGGTAIQSQTIPEWENGYLPGYTSRKDGEVVTWWNEDGTEQYELDENGTTFTNLVMSDGLADENGVVKVYAHWETCPEGYTIKNNKCIRPVTYNTDNITYIDTNGKVFSGIGTITITDGTTSITMLDRNLGAEVSGTGEDSYGYHFQWGNNYGFTRVENYSDEFAGDEILVDGSMNGYVDASSNSWNNPYVSSRFIAGYYGNNGGWDGGDDSSYNHDLWGGADEYYNDYYDSTVDYKRQGPCPAGYHVPSHKELDDLILMYSDFFGGNVYYDEYGYGYEMNDAGEHFSNTFKIPFAGYRGYEYGSVDRMNDGAYLWSSSIKDSYYPQSHELFLDDSRVFSQLYLDARGYALSVRCFQDSPLDDSGTEPLILEYKTNGGSAIQSQTIPEGEDGYLPGYTTHRDGADFLGWFNEDGSVQYELDENGVTFTNLVMSDGLADENGVVKVYAHWKTCPEGYTIKNNKCIRVTYNADNITYTDTNGKVFSGIGTITFTDCDGTNEDTCKTITMLDRNLGATSTDIDDEDSYGYHFQWGNNYGFDPNFNINIIDGDQEGFADTSENGWNNPYVSSDFITDPDGDNDGGWDGGDDQSYNNDLWGGADDYNNGWGDSTADYKRQGPCPAGYHVPSGKELDDLRDLYYSYYSTSTDFTNAFNLPFAGIRDFSYGDVGGMGSYGYGYGWSSSAYGWGGPNSRMLGVDAYGVWDFDFDKRGYGLSIRCFQDSPLDDNGTQPLILEYETDGGSAIQSQTIPAGENAYLPGYTTHKDGVNFLGWFNEDGTEQYELEMGNPSSNFTMSADMADDNGVVKVYAKWNDMSTYTITWNYKDVDGVAASTTTSVAYGATPTAPEVPAIATTVDKIYTFSNAWSPAISEVDGEATYEAQYTSIARPYTITWNYKDVDGVAASTTTSVAYGATPEAPEVPELSQSATTVYRFTGWDPEILNVTGIKTYTAKYNESAREYTITIDTDGGEEIAPITVAYGTKPIAPEIKNKIYYHFIGWDPAFPETMPAHDMIIKVIWEENGRSGGGGMGRRDNFEQEHGVTEDKVVDKEISKENNQSQNKADESGLDMEKYDARYPLDFNEAYQFSYNNKITTINTIKDAKMYTPLTRIQMAKMLSYYAMNVLNQTPDASKGMIKFRDVTNRMNAEYDNAVTLAYQLGIMGINMPNNKFRPNDYVTRGEFATALSRMVYGIDDGRGRVKYYEPHIAKLYNEGIISDTNPKMRELRGYVMLMLARISK